MVISVGASFKTELEREGGARPVYLLDFDFTTGFRRFALWPHDVSFGGNTYFALGPVGNIAPLDVAGNSPLGEHDILFFVQNDPDLLADIQQNSRGRFYTLRLVFLDASNAVVNNEAIVLAKRRMVPGPLRGGRGTYTSVIGTESIFHRHRNRAPRTYSDTEQIKRDVTDFAFRDIGKNLDTSRPRYRQKSGLG